MWTVQASINKIFSSKKQAVLVHDQRSWKNYYELTWIIPQKIIKTNAQFWLTAKRRFQNTKDDYKPFKYKRQFWNNKRWQIIGWLNIVELKNLDILNKNMSNQNSLRLLVVHFWKWLRKPEISIRWRKHVDKIQLP